MAIRSMLVGKYTLFPRVRASAGDHPILICEQGRTYGVDVGLPSISGEVGMEGGRARKAGRKQE